MQICHPLDVPAGPAVVAAVQADSGLKVTTTQLGQGSTPIERSGLRTRPDGRPQIQGQARGARLRGRAILSAR
jgi:hypothetical protein